MELANQVVCPCTGKSYKCIRSHYQTKLHKSWENENEIKELRIINKKNENQTSYEIKNLLDIIEKKDIKIKELEEKLSGTPRIFNYDLLSYFS